MSYKIKIYPKGQAGYFQYTVGSLDSACDHASAIMRECTYRRQTPRGEIEFWSVYKVKIEGEGIESEYLDEFIRT